MFTYSIKALCRGGIPGVGLFFAPKGLVRMAKVDRLNTKLTAVNARIAEIVAGYPDLAKYKSYSKGFGEISTTYQDFGAVGKEYRELLAIKDSLEDQIAEITDNEGGSTLAAFRAVL